MALSKEIKNLNKTLKTLKIKSEGSLTKDILVLYSKDTFQGSSQEIYRFEINLINGDIYIGKYDSYFWSNYDKSNILPGKYLVDIINLLKYNKIPGYNLL